MLTKDRTLKMPFSDVTIEKSCIFVSIQPSLKQFLKMQLKCYYNFKYCTYSKFKPQILI